MLVFVLLGCIYFMGNILLAWATMQQAYVSKILSSLPPQNKNDWVHLLWPVFFFYVVGTIRK